MKHKPATDTAKLDTEQRNSASRNLDQLSSLEIASIMNMEDAKVARAVKKALPQIARAIDCHRRFIPTRWPIDLCRRGH